MFQKYVLDPILSTFTKFKGRNSFLIGETFYTYNDLIQYVSKIRCEIRRRHNRSKNIGLVANDDIETYSAIIAIWLEGYAYVPVHPRYPEERSAEVFKQAGVELVADSLGENTYKDFYVVNTGKLEPSILDIAPKGVSDSELAYILFTSGSTGSPKGVPITRGNLGSFMKSFWEVGFKIDENDRCLQCFDLTFDVSVQSFLVPLSKGACIYTIPHGQIKPGYAYTLMDEHKLTFGAMAPSMIRFLRPYFDEIKLPNIKYNILTAEASPLGLLEEWSRCVPNAEIYDFYGPTEATIYCTYYKFDRAGNNKHLNGMISIGRPLNGVRAIITDEEGFRLPNGKKGELCISGPQITPGYWNNIEKNVTAFLDKEIEGKSVRFYRTGDLCYFDPDGDIMYSGRLDFQVKIQGFRVELGEIEHHAREYLKGSDVVAIAFRNSSGNDAIALFVEKPSIKTEGLSDYLKSKIPYYMIPSRIVEKDTFPLNSNGKTDRNLLRKSIENM